MLLNVQKCSKTFYRHKTFYTPYKIILFTVSCSKFTGILHFFTIEKKSLSNHWKTFGGIFCLPPIKISMFKSFWILMCWLPWITDIKNKKKGMSSFRKVYTVNSETILSCIVCSLRNNKICLSWGNRKKFNLFSL